MKRIAEQSTPKRVRVLPRDDIIRRDIVHPVNKIGFPPQGGSIEWPLDAFTKRRLRDGDVTIEPEKPKEETPAPAARRSTRTFAS
jgi:hypothetical protein